MMLGKQILYLYFLFCVSSHCSLCIGLQVYDLEEQIKETEKELDEMRKENEAEKRAKEELVGINDSFVCWRVLLKRRIFVGIDC
jgi:hypothetical protein